MTKYLSLPSTPAELLDPSSPRLQLLVTKCADHPRVHSMLKPSANPGLVTYPLKLNSLIALPQDYGDLINSISGFTCPNVSENNFSYKFDSKLYNFIYLFSSVTCIYYLPVDVRRFKSSCDVFSLWRNSLLTVILLSNYIKRWNEDWSLHCSYGGLRCRVSRNISKSSRM